MRELGRLAADWSATHLQWATVQRQVAGKSRNLTVQLPVSHTNLPAAAGAQTVPGQLGTGATALISLVRT